MSWQGLPAAPPAGYELAQLRDGDDLAGLEREECQRRGVDASSKANRDRVGLEISTANGVPHPKAKTCAWARDLAALVLASGGQRFGPDPKVPNSCEPGEGFVGFSSRSRIYLPAGLRPRVDAPASAPTPSPRGTRAPLFAALGLGAALVVGRVFRKRKAT